MAFEILTPTADLPKERPRQQAYEEVLEGIFNNPESAALVLVDLQNDFLSLNGKCAVNWHQDISAMRAILPTIEQLTDIFYALKRPVIRTKTYENPEFRPAPGLDRFAIFEGGEQDYGIACIQGTKGADLYVSAKPGDFIVEKKAISALHETNLLEILNNTGSTSVFVAGVKTNRCVFHTVSDLYREQSLAHVLVIEDCVASEDPEAHKYFLRELTQFLPPVLHSSRVIDAWGQKV